MKITHNHPITAEIKAYADAIKVCGQYSIDNPTCAIKDNPFVKPADRAHRKATGSVRVLIVCPCNKVSPLIDDQLRTECCHNRVVSFHDHR